MQWGTRPYPFPRDDAAWSRLDMALNRLASYTRHLGYARHWIYKCRPEFGGRSAAELILFAPEGLEVVDAQPKADLHDLNATLQPPDF